MRYKVWVFFKNILTHAKLKYYQDNERLWKLWKMKKEILRNVIVLSTLVSCFEKKNELFKKT